MPNQVLSEAITIDEFLLCETPSTWLDTAKEQLETLLIDHAHCELKAASTALSLIFKYPQHQQLCIELSKLAREELLHFEKVMAELRHRNIPFQHLSASRYAGSLLNEVRNRDPEQKLVDTLIIGSIIEARSCERFQKLIPLLEPDLASFYQTLVKSEARHFVMYLSFAQQISTSDISQRVHTLLKKEKKLIESEDNLFRFHSGAYKQNSLAAVATKC